MNIIDPRSRLSGILGLIGGGLMVLSVLAGAVLTFYYLFQLIYPHVYPHLELILFPTF